MRIYETYRDSLDLLEKEDILVMKVWDYGLYNEVKNLLEFTLETVKSNQLQDIILDLTLWPNGLPEGLNKWFEEDFLPRSIYSDVEQIAVLLPTDPFSLVEFEYMMEILDNLFKIKYFKNIEYAKTWILNIRYMKQFSFSNN